MRRILRIINEIPLIWMVAALAAVIVGFAGIYWALGHLGAGLLEFTYETDRSMTFGDALYFSLVTVSSLGYGDIRPIGWTRMFVGGEVIMGLAFFGILVAKISSVKQDHILRQMYYAELIEVRLSKYTESLDEYRKLYRITSNMLLDGEIDPDLTTTFVSDTEEATLFYQIGNVLDELTEMIEFEISNGGFFGDVSVTTMSRIYSSVHSVLKHTASILRRDPERTYAHVMCGNEDRVLGILDSAEKLAKLGKRNSRNRDFVDQCQAILSLVQELRPSLQQHLATTCQVKPA